MRVSERERCCCCYFSSIASIKPHPSSTGSAHRPGTFATRHPCKATRSWTASGWLDVPPCALLELGLYFRPACAWLRTACGAPLSISSAAEALACSGELQATAASRETKYLLLNAFAASASVLKPGPHSLGVFNSWLVIQRGAPVSLPTHHNKTDQRMSPSEFASLKRRAVDSMTRSRCRCPPDASNERKMDEAGHASAVLHAFLQIPKQRHCGMVAMEKNLHNPDIYHHQVEGSLFKQNKVRHSGTELSDFGRTSLHHHRTVSLVDAMVLSCSPPRSPLPFSGRRVRLAIVRLALSKLSPCHADPRVPCDAFAEAPWLTLTWNQPMSMRGPLPTPRFTRGSAKGPTLANVSVGACSVRWLSTVEPFEKGHINSQLAGHSRASGRVRVWACALHVRCKLPAHGLRGRLSFVFWCVAPNAGDVVLAG